MHLEPLKFPRLLLLLHFCRRGVRQSRSDSSLIILPPHLPPPLLLFLPTRTRMHIHFMPSAIVSRVIYGLFLRLRSLALRV